MSDLISREEALSHPFANGKYDKENANQDFILGFESYKEWLETLPTVDIMECARAMKKACGEIDCAFCPIHYLCCVEDIRPFDWNLPEGEAKPNDNTQNIGCDHND